jgi:hypothetical protein
MKAELLDWRLQYAIDYFNKQQEAMNRLKERIALTSALLLTPIGSAIYFIYINSNFKDLNNSQQIPLGISLFIATTLFVVSASYIFCTLTKAYEYPYPQLPSNLSKFFNQLTHSCYAPIVKVNYKDEYRTVRNI